MTIPEDKKLTITCPLTSLEDGTLEFGWQDITITLSGVEAPTLPEELEPEEPDPEEPTPDPDPEPEEPPVEPEEPPVEPEEPEPPVVTEIPIGDIAALQDDGLVQVYRTDITPPAEADDTIDWSGAPGERGEIGLIPNDHAALIAGHSYLRGGILAAAIDPVASQKLDTWSGKKGVDHAHKPNLFWVPFLMTGDPTYIRHMEAVHAQFEAYKSHTPERPALPRTDGRLFAWSIRDLGQLAFLQRHGLTRRTDYADQLEQTRQWCLRVMDGDLTTQMYPEQRYMDNLHEFRVFKLNQSGGWKWWGWSPWMESFVGIALSHLVRLGFDEWMPVLEWHGQQLFYRSGDKWPLKALDNAKNFYSQYWSQLPVPPTNESEALEVLPQITWDTLTPYAPDDMPIYHAQDDNEVMPIIPAVGNPTGKRMAHYNRAQYAYHWAESLAQLGVTGARERADIIFASVEKRDGVPSNTSRWDYKNAIINDAGAVMPTPDPDPVPDPDPDPDPVPDPDPIPDPDPAPDGWPTWRKEMQPQTWREIPTANRLIDLDPRYRPDLNPVYPAQPEWDAVGGFDAIVKAWCGACVDQETGTLHIPLHGGHADRAGNEPYKIHLLAEQPEWVMLRPPTGALPDCVITRDGEEMELTGMYADGRVRATHTYNTCVYVPDMGPALTLLGGTSWGAQKGFQHSVFIHPDSGELIRFGEKLVYKAGSGCYDSKRHGFWMFPNGTGRYTFYNIATGEHTEYGYIRQSSGTPGLEYVPTLDLVVVRRFSRWFLFDPNRTEKGDFETPITLSDPVLDFPAGRHAPNPCYVEADHSIYAWDNREGERPDKITRLIIPENPKTDVWTIEHVYPAAQNTVIPTHAVKQGTYGRFQYIKKLDGFIVFNGVEQPIYFFARA